MQAAKAKLEGRCAELEQKFQSVEAEAEAGRGRAEELQQQWDDAATRQERLQAVHSKTDF